MNLQDSGSYLPSFASKQKPFVYNITCWKDMTYSSLVLYLGTKVKMTALPVSMIQLNFISWCFVQPAFLYWMKDNMNKLKGASAFSIPFPFPSSQELPHLLEPEVAGVYHTQGVRNSVFQLP